MQNKLYSLETNKRYKFPDKIIKLNKKRTSPI